MLLQEYGNIYLSKEEMRMRLTQRLEAYYAFLADSFFNEKAQMFWKFHKEGLEKLNLFCWAKLIETIMVKSYYKIAHVIVNPQEVFLKIFKILKA